MKKRKKRELLDGNLSAGPPSSVGSELRCYNTPCRITASAEVVPRMAPPGAART